MPKHRWTWWAGLRTAMLIFAALFFVQLIVFQTNFVDHAVTWALGARAAWAFSDTVLQLYRPFVEAVARAAPEDSRTMGNMYIAIGGVALGAACYAAAASILAVAVSRLWTQMRRRRRFRNSRL